MAQVPARPPTAAPDWTVTTADTVERVVGSIRDKTTVPLTTVARALVYGPIAAVMGVAILVLLSIVAVRIGASYLPFDHARATWVTEGGIGLLFVLFGAWLLRKANARTTTTT
jgi:hypothetical protein